MVLPQCWFRAGPPSATLAQLSNNNGQRVVSVSSVGSAAYGLSVRGGGGDNADLSRIKINISIL